MNLLLSFVVLAVFSASAFAKESSPKIQVYSHHPGELGKPNTLICHVSNFHPPDITITLLKDGVEIPDAKQSDLSFEKTWMFQLLKSAPFTPKNGEKYSCRVRHMVNTKDITWEADM